MIIETEPKTMAEVKEILKDIDTEKAKNCLTLIKKFIKNSDKESKEIKESIKKLGLEKLKEEDIVKIVDFMPEDAESIRKIFAGSDISLEQDEITKILEIKTSK